MNIFGSNGRVPSQAEVERTLAAAVNSGLAPGMMPQSNLQIRVYLQKGETIECVVGNRLYHNAVVKSVVYDNPDGVPVNGTLIMHPAVVELTYELEAGEEKTANIMWKHVTHFERLKPASEEVVKP